MYVYTSAVQGASPIFFIYKPKSKDIGVRVYSLCLDLFLGDVLLLFPSGPQCCDQEREHRAQALTHYIISGNIKYN